MFELTSARVEMTRSCNPRMKIPGVSLVLKYRNGSENPHPTRPARQQGWQGDCGTGADRARAQPPQSSWPSGKRCQMPPRKPRGRAHEPSSCRRSGSAAAAAIGVVTDAARAMLPEKGKHKSRRKGAAAGAMH